MADFVLNVLGVFLRFSVGCVDTVTKADDVVCWVLTSGGDEVGVARVGVEDVFCLGEESRKECGKTVWAVVEVGGLGDGFILEGCIFFERAVMFFHVREEAEGVVGGEGVGVEVVVEVVGVGVAEGVGGEETAGLG